MNTKSVSIYDLVSRIERAPNMSRVIDAYDAALGGSDVSCHRYRGQWQVWHGERSGFCGDFGQVRAHLAEAAEEILERAAEAAAQVAPKPAMIEQPVQQQQACAAAPTPWSDLWTRVSSRVERLALLDVIEASVSEFRRDPYTGRGLPVVRLDGDRHILLGWAENEDAAAACGRNWAYSFDVACLVTGEAGPLAYVLLGNGDALAIDVDFLRQQAGAFEAPITAFDGDGAEVDECDERAVRWTVGEWTFGGHNPACDFARLCEGLGFVPAFNPAGMIEQPCQQQQAQAGRAEPAAEVPPAAQPEPEAAEVEPSASYKLGPIDRRCRHWERVLREGVALPMPEDVHGAGDLPGSYAPDRGEEELFGLDAVIQGEENHHRRSRGWSYWLHVRNPADGYVETIQPSAARKTVIKDAIRAGRIDLPREILKGAGDIAALVRILSAIRAGLPIEEIVDAE